MTDKKCPQCGGPANHPVGSSACKRIGIQRTDKDVKDVIEAYKRLCDAKRRRGKQKAHEDWDCTIQTLEINLEAALDRLVEQDKQDG
jgi:hypothetical protein